MEAVPMNKSGDYKHRIGNPKRNFVTNRTLYSYPSDDLILTSFLAGGHFGGGGLLSLPPSSLSHSYPPVNLQRHRQQPPLLPLPISTPIHHQNMNLNNIYRSNSCSNNNNIRLSPPRINNNIRLTPKKSKNQKKKLKREEADLVAPAVAEVTEAPPAAKRLTESSIGEMIGPDPKDLPKDVMSRVFSGSVVFTPSPPPSSLPLPTFSLRPKLSCNAQAADVDAGATNSLRRLLRL